MGKKGKKASQILRQNNDLDVWLPFFSVIFVYVTSLYCCEVSVIFTLLVPQESCGDKSLGEWHFTLLLWQSCPGRGGLKAENQAIFNFEHM